jgi:fatty-acyl-CoA synthase
MHTGDIGVIEPNGYLRVVDRIKDVIKTGGEWVSSIEVEDLISQYKGVSEAAVIGVPSEKWGERPLAVVVRDGSSQITSAEIKAHLESSVEAGAIPKFAIPDEIIFVTAIPRTSVGKFDKKALGEQYARGSLAVAAEDSGNASFLGDRSSAVMTGRREP